MTWRVAESLEVLRKQFNSRYPNRSKVSDGGIGDAAHASRSSDHNPWLKKGGQGIVTARDYTHDPAHGMDIDRLTDELAASRDPRIKYIIANGLILDSRPGHHPWRWMPYHGSNKHNKHFHLSVHPHNCDDATPWNLPTFGGPDPTPESNAPGGIESMAMDTVWTDSYGNKQTVQGFMSETQRDINELHAAILGIQQSRIPGDKNRTNAANAIMDSTAWTAQIMGMVAALRGQSGVSPDDVAESLKPVIAPVVSEAVSAALGQDNEAQAAEIVDEITKRLSGEAA